MKRIDLENHFYIPEFIDTMKSRRGIPRYDAETHMMHLSNHVSFYFDAIFKELTKLYDERVEAMDKAGIDCAVLSSSCGIEELDPETSIALCRKTNDLVYDHIVKYPGRFYGSAVVPVQDPGAACAELERCVKEYGFVSWHTHSNYGDTRLDDPRYFPILKKAEELGAYVYLHPALPDDERMRDLGFALSGAALGFTVDTQITLIRMMLTGIFDRLPGLNVMIGHLGEALPFLLERIDKKLADTPEKRVTKKQSIKHYFRNNIYVSTSGNVSAEAFDTTVKVLGTDRVVIGTDMPYEEPKVMIDFLDEMPLCVADREKLYFRNAERLFENVFGRISSIAV